MRMHLLRVAFVVTLACCSLIGNTGAYYSDEGASFGNQLVSGTLDFTVAGATREPMSSLYEVSPILPGDSEIRSFRAFNDGNLDLVYALSLTQTGGNDLFCEALQLKVERLGVQVYDGPLLGLSLSDLTLAALGSEDWTWSAYFISEATSLQNRSCEFAVDFRAYQAGSDGSWGFADSVSLPNSITSGSWFLPTPVLAYPMDGESATLVNPAWLNNPRMDWNPVVWSEAVTYQYQSAHTDTLAADGSFAAPVFTSSWLTDSEIPASGTPDGTYYWHVRAKSGSLISAWSDVWLLTVDRSMQPGYVVINEVMWMGGIEPLDEWIELRNMTGVTIDLTGWKIINAGVNSGSPRDITLSGSIPANGYFLLSNYTTIASSINGAVDIDQVTTSLELSNGGEQLMLQTASALVVDQTPTGGWSAGINGVTGQADRSMERNDIPGDGTLPGNWHTCFDESANDPPFWDEGVTLIYGTPKAANLSSNDPSAPDYQIGLMGDEQEFNPVVVSLEPEVFIPVVESKEPISDDNPSIVPILPDDLIPPLSNPLDPPIISAQVI